MSEDAVVVVAGGAGDLGSRIARALVVCGADVRVLVRPGVSDAQRARIAAPGIALVEADPMHVERVAGALDGAACVVSALNGTRSAIMDRQGVLLDAAIKAGVPRFIPSDFAADFTKTEPGRNRNFDFRREFMARLDAAPIRATSVLNGAFLDMLGAEMPIIQPRIRRVLYWHDADQGLDFTAKDDVAAYTARAALDEAAPRILRIAGDTVSVRDLAATMGAVTGERYRPLWAGSLGTLGAMIRAAKLIAPQPDEAFPPWQGMQYMRDQFSGLVRLSPLDNSRYPDLAWTSSRQHLERRFGPPLQGAPQA